jgi:hypothetical protein
MVVAILALIVALGGTAIAALKLPANSVGTSQLKNNAVTPPKLAASTVASLKGQPGKQGPPGPEGLPGQNGSNATINGVSAGGDLAGTYPSPTIAAGAITTDKLGTVPAAEVTNSSTQAIPNGAETNLTWNTNRLDNDGLHSTTTNTDELVAPVSGTYIVTAMTAWAGNGTGTRTLQLNRLSTTNPLQVTDTFASSDEIGETDSGVEFQDVAGITHLSAGQAVVAEVFQDSGGTLNAQNFCRFAVAWLGP